MRSICRFYLIILSVLFVNVAPPDVMAADSAVILMYHRVGEDEYPTTNVRLDQFKAHIDMLTNGPFHLASLDEIMSVSEGQATLPDRTVAITVDDAFRSFYDNAWPILRDKDIPFAIFPATKPLDDESGDYMTWRQLRELYEAGVTIGNHTVSHGYLLTMDLAAVMEEVAGANQRLRDELGFVPRYFAYPFGEYSETIQGFVRQMGFRAAFAQYSGVVYDGSDRYAIPRFSLNQNYAGTDRFELIVNALPIRVRSVIPSDPHIRHNPPAFGFTLEPPFENKASITCFPSHMSEPAALVWLSDTRAETRFDRALPAGRSRINCTAPGPQGRWRWFGYPFFVR